MTHRIFLIIKVKIVEFDISPYAYVIIYFCLTIPIACLYPLWLGVPLGIAILIGMYNAFDITIAFALTLIIFKIVWVYKNINNPDNDDSAVEAARELIALCSKEEPPDILFFKSFTCSFYIKDRQLHVIENTQEKREFVVSAVLKNRIMELIEKDSRITYDELLEYCKSKNYKVIEKNKKVEQEDLEKVDINLATLEEIQKLPGINIITAKKIIAKREELDGYSSIDEVLQVIHVSKRMDEMLRQRIMILPKMKSIYVNLNNDEREVDL